MGIVFDVGVAVEDQHRSFLTVVRGPVIGNPGAAELLPAGLYLVADLTAARWSTLAVSTAPTRER